MSDELFVDLTEDDLIRQHSLSSADDTNHSSSNSNNSSKNNSVVPTRNTTEETKPTAAAATDSVSDQSEAMDEWVTYAAYAECENSKKEEQEKVGSATDSTATSVDREKLLQIGLAWKRRVSKHHSMKFNPNLISNTDSLDSSGGISPGLLTHEEDDELDSSADTASSVITNSEKVKRDLAVNTALGAKQSASLTPSTPMTRIKELIESDKGDTRGPFCVSEICIAFPLQSPVDSNVTKSGNIAVKPPTYYTTSTSNITDVVVEELSSITHQVSSSLSFCYQQFESAINAVFTLDSDNSTNSTNTNLTATTATKTTTLNNVGKQATSFNSALEVIDAESVYAYYSTPSRVYVYGTLSERSKYFYELTDGSKNRYIGNQVLLLFCRVVVRLCVFGGMNNYRYRRPCC